MNEQKANRMLLKISIHSARSIWSNQAGVLSDSKMKTFFPELTLKKGDQSSLDNHTVCLRLN